MSSKTDIHLSKTLSWLLRHSGIKEGLQFSDDGYASVSDLLKHHQLRSYALEDVKRVVECNVKQRFDLKTEEGTLYIRANQGHSLDVNVKLTPITLLELEHFPTVVHGTYLRFWSQILQNGLSRMKRNHIHFCNGHPLQSDIKSGVRRSCDTYIYIDMNLALQNNFEFFLSSNNVILCPGDSNGYLPVKYFLRVTVIETASRSERQISPLP